jgi:hypothetical protein
MKKVPYTLSENSITVFWEGKPYTVRKDNANFQGLRQALFDARYDEVGDFLDITKAIENFVEGEIEVKDEVVYYKGHRLHGVVVDKLLEMLRAGMKDSAPLTNFITRLQANPSANSVNQLYSFLSYKSLPNDEEGMVLGYKGVQKDFWSNSGNADTIVVQGKTNDRHQILNEVGATIEVSRRCVDDNKDNHCSFGLHIGSYDYANSWAGDEGRLLVVKFDPQDAVSVPDDCDFQKLRVCKYTVVEDITGTRKEIDKPVYEANKVIYGSDNDFCDDEDYDSDDYDDDEGRDYLNNEDDDFDDDDVPEGDCDNFSQDMAKLAIRNYIENKHEQGINPTINHIASLQICRDEGFRCRDVASIVKDLGFNMEDDHGKILSEQEVFSRYSQN